jgi:DNA-binding LacI/PurR family transcriptional regulator
MTSGEPSAHAAGVREVAMLAGVSRQTVSRVLNGHPSIRESTKARVLAAIDELQFRPNRAARMLTTSHSRTIGILASSGASLFGPSRSIEAVEKAAQEAGYFATIAHVDELTSEAVESAVDHLTDQAVEGIIIVAPQVPVLAAMRAITMSVPSVTLHGEDATGGDGAFVDQLTGARLATRHLVDLGHTKLAHLSGPENWAEAAARRRGFSAEVEAQGLEGVISRPGDWTAASGYEIGRALVADRAITGVFSSNDQMALGLFRAIRESGRRIPQDVSVVGFDDIPEAAFFEPPLTTVRQEFAELGRRAVEGLLAAMRGTAVPDQPAETPALVVRESCGPAPD